MILAKTNKIVVRTVKRVKLYPNYDYNNLSVKKFGYII